MRSWTSLSGRGHSSTLVGYLLLMALATCMACGDDGGITGSGDAPADHTINKRGAMHKPGLENATVDCTSCHGADLMGGPNGQPSCFTCHGRRWN